MATSGRLPASYINPSSLAPSAYRPFAKEHSIHATPSQLLENYRKNPLDKPPGYLPEATDFLHYPKELKPLGVLDYSAQGRTEYSHEQGYRGIRPIVDTFSITRFSPAEWKAHNQDLLVTSHKKQNKCENAEWHGLECIENVRLQTDDAQRTNTERLWRREKEIYHWQTQLEDGIERMQDEIDLLKRERVRLQNSRQMVLIPMSIARESIHRRTSRIDIELVRDEVEEALSIEMSLTAQIKDLLEQTLRDLEMQMIENTSALRQMTYDWAEKVRAYELESTNAELRNYSTTIQWKHGITQFPNDQSTVELWNKFVKDIHQNAERIREQSANFRGTLDAILIHAARDLRTQADKVELAFSNRIAITEEIRRQLEIELKKVMRKIADAEGMFPKLKESMQRLDYPLKVAQTRLNNKSIRPKVENCRDISQYGLINEVKLLNESVSELRSRLSAVEESHAELQILRGRLERDLALKRKSLEIDRWILNDVRSRFPSATDLCGYIDPM